MTHHPTWARQRVLVIPQSLEQRIEGLLEPEQIKLCRIVSEVVIKTKKNPVLFKPVSTERFFKNAIGSDYKRFVNQLTEWKFIEVNPRYRSTGKRKFCMSYRLTYAAAASEKRRITFEKKIVQPLRDRSTLTDDVSGFVYRNLQRLTIRGELLPQSDLVDSVAAEQWAEKIYWRKFDLKYSRSVRRMFHSVIVMPRVARRNLVLRESPATPLFEYDIKSCHPVLMLALVKKSGDDRNAFADLLNGDIYATVAQHCGIEADRDDMKVDFLKFANGEAKNYYYKYFSQRFSRLVEFMDRNKKKMAWLCQATEAKIMTQIVPQMLMASNKQDASSNLNLTQDSLICGGNSEIFYVPMHDGWLGIEKDEPRIAEVVRDDFYKRVGYPVTITKTPVTGGDKAMLHKEVPQVPVEQLTWHR